MSGEKAVVTLVYRHILRWHKRLDGVPLPLKPSHITELVPNLPELRHEHGATVRRIAQRAFRQQLSALDSTGPVSPQEHKAALLDRGFRALQLLNTEYAQAFRSLQLVQLEHQSTMGVLHAVGTVFRHRKFGYKGVIYGWDRTCDRPEGWAQQMNVDGNQPFYWVLPDEPDCVRLFKSVRTSKYVAQENVEVLQSERIVHRALLSYFTDYSPQLGRYIPNAKTQYEYPGDYQASDAHSCAADSNLLLHADPYPYNDPYADPYEDGPGSQHSQCPAEQAEASAQTQAAAEPQGTAEEQAEGRAAADGQNEQQPSQSSQPADQALPEPEQSLGTDVKR